MADVKAALTPPDCDLQDFPFMPLMVARLRKSKAWVKARRNPALGFYMVNLWMAAWHEVPAGSLEDDDDVLADAAMCETAKWPKVREEVLRGWVKGEDGRLYHPVVCERALEAWQAKGERRERNDHENDRKRREREERAQHFSALKEAGIHKPWNTSLTDLRKAVHDLSGGQVSDGPAAVRNPSRLREGQGEGYGERQGQGERQGSSSEAKASGGKPPMTPEEIIFGYGLSLLTNAGTPEKQARSFLGGLRKGRDDADVVNALRDCIRAKPLQPLEWLAAALPPIGGKGKPNAQEALEASNRGVVERLLAKENAHAT